MFLKAMQKRGRREERDGQELHYLEVCSAEAHQGPGPARLEARPPMLPLYPRTGITLVQASV